MDLLRGLQKQLADLERRAVPRGIRAAEGYRNAGSPVASARPLMNPVVATGLSGVGMAANLLSRGAVIPSLIEKTKEVFNPKDNIITSLRNFGTSVENQFAAPGQERRYVGSSPAAVASNRRLDASRPLNAIDTGKYGPTDWNPSANPLSAPSAAVLPPSAGGAADRAYQQEKARVTQMTEQDPMFKKYQVAELTKAYNTASPEEKNKIGLQIWAATNPDLAKKVPPGQVGYQTAASMSGSQVFGTDIPGVTETIYSQAGQKEGVPGGVQFPGSEQATKMNSFSMGADAQQLGVTPPGTTPFPMIGENVFKRGFEVPSSEDLSQTQLALLKRAFESRIK